MPTSPVTVHLGDQSYVLVPQKHTRLKRALGDLFDSLGDTDVTEGRGLMDVLGDKAYDALRVFIPALMPRYRWEGYATQAGFETDDPDAIEDSDVPTVPQITEAIRSAAEVNGLTGFKSLGKVVSPELIRALIGQNIASLVAESATRNSKSLPSANGEPTSTPTTTTPPTSTASEDGPSSDSSDSPSSTPSDESVSSVSSPSPSP